MIRGDWQKIAEELLILREKLAKESGIPGVKKSDFRNLLRLMVKVVVQSQLCFLKSFQGKYEDVWDLGDLINKTGLGFEKVGINEEELYCLAKQLAIKEALAILSFLRKGQKEEGQEDLTAIRLSEIMAEFSLGNDELGGISSEEEDKFGLI